MDRSDQRPYEEKLALYIRDNNISATQMTFETSCHSVAEAAAAVGATAADFIKTICMSTKSGLMVAVIVKGEDRADRQGVQKLLDIGRLSIASPAEMIERTGFPAGGTPPFGFDAQFLIDERVFEIPEVFGGGGSEHSLIRATPAALQRASHARIATVRVVAAPAETRVE